ncbi:MAG: phage tail tube protein [Phycisphaeraceae bacterium]
MSFKLGMHAVLYLGAELLDDTTAPADVTWSEQDNVRDVTLSLETGEADVTTRGNQGWRATAATLKDGSIEFEMIWKPGDSGFEQIKDAWLASDELSAAVMDGDITTADNQGLVSNFTVTNFSRSEPLEEAITVSVTLKPSSRTQWYVVSGS